MTPAESVRLILNARGLPVLAHPVDIEDLDILLPELIKAGLVGIEVFYTKYTPETMSRLLTIAQQHKLIATGGTDYHHFEDGKEDSMGTVFIPSQSVEQLFSLADKRNLELIKGRKYP